ncbi:His/Gly/Thr/Pro-type tRNA ligase C-terminal domain-containing protein, partial [Chloroflexota bacterium]
LAAILRQAGIGVIMSTGGRSLKAQLRQANSLGIGHAVIIGEEELKTGMAVLRDMANASQETIATGELVNRLR